MAATRSPYNNTRSSGSTAKPRRPPTRRTPTTTTIAGGWLRLRLRGRRRRGQQLLAGGGAQPSGQLLVDGGEARLPAHGTLLLFLLHQAEADYGGGATPWQRHQQLHHTLVLVFVCLPRRRRCSRGLAICKALLSNWLLHENLDALN